MAWLRPVIERGSKFSRCKIHSATRRRTDSRAIRSSLRSLGSQRAKLRAISKPASSLLPEPRDRPRREPGESPEAGRSGEKNRIIINIEENYNFFVGLTNGCQLAAVTESVPFFEILFFFFAVISSSIKRPRGKENLACSP